MEDLFPLESTWILPAVAAVVIFFMLKRLLWALPFQNVLLIVVGLAVGEGLLEMLVEKVGRIDVPDPRWRYELGATFLWVAVALGARRMAKLIARPWRKEKVHWLWILALGGVGTAAFQFGWPLLDPDFPFHAKAFSMAGVRGGGTMILLGCLGPWFIRKKPRPGKDFSELPDDPEDDTKQKA